MKRKRVILLWLLLLSSIAACSPGHLGSNEIAFLRNGQLWTIDPDGANAFTVVADAPEVVSYGWSPNHQLLTFRTLDPSFAKTTAGKHIAHDPVSGLTGDWPGTLNTISIDGGMPIPLIFSNPDVRFSAAWWTATGNRLIYRETPTASTSVPPPGSPLWWISQNDQPGGIARKLLPSTFSIPSIDTNSIMAIGNSQRGLFTTSIAGTDIHYLVQGALVGHPLIASLERVLWQPAHEQPAIVYALPSTTQPDSFNASPQVQLVLRTMQGRSMTLATCTCTQFAWSPDGNAILYSTGTTYTILNIQNSDSFSFTGENGSVPYWSPDSQFLVLDGMHTLILIDRASKGQQVLLSDTDRSTPEETVIPDASTLLQPVANSLWASDSRHFLFLTKGRLIWQGKNLSSDRGLYTVTIDNAGKVQGGPTIVDTGNDIQAGWTYEDANTSFLF
jgi:hypothetical protein